MSKQDFTYNACLSDHKLGNKPSEYFNYFAHARPGRRHDFMGKYQAQGLALYEIFEKLGLPLPKPEDIHHGSDGQLLFLSHHGIVVRIGAPENADPTNFLHPHILQPVGWITDEENHLTVSFYAGAHLYETWDYEAPFINEIAQSLSDNSFKNGDLRSNNNIGYLKLKSGKAYPVCIDISSRIEEGLSDSFTRYYSTECKTKTAFKEARTTRSAFDALRVLFRNGNISSFTKEEQEEAFDIHKPLRRAFFSAWPNADKNEGSPDPEKMKKFWQMARNYTDAGYKIFGNPSLKSSPENAITAQTSNSIAISPVSESPSKPSSTLSSLWRKVAGALGRRDISFFPAQKSAKPKKETPEKTILVSRQTPVAWQKSV